MFGKWLSVLALLCLGLLVMRLSLGAARTHGVSIQSMQFTPARISINGGDSVTWSNRDERDHRIVAEDNSFRSGNLSSGQSYTHTFPKPGRFAYGCGYHPREKGMVVVEE